jgi:UDP-N-acetyl-D-galactosamine dehydrogenase
MADLASANSTFGNAASAGGRAAYIAQQAVKQMIRNGSSVKGAKVVVLGLTFKENCPDLRNSKVADLVKELQSFGCDVAVHDPIAVSAEAIHEYGIPLTPWNELPPQAEAIVAAVSHHQYLAMPLAEIFAKLRPGGVFVDVKSAYDPLAIQSAGYTLWRL